MNINLSEIWLGIQGESIYVGEQQLFIRTAGCPLMCQFCDTIKALSIPSYCQVFGLPEDFILSNPVNIEQVVNLLDQIEKVYPTICLTGGEPLIQVDALKCLLIGLKEKIPNTRFYLETNGILYQELASIINLIDIISMDIKLPSATGLDAFWDEHSQFLKIASDLETFVKIVISNKTPLIEMEKAISIIDEIDCKIPLIIQPLNGQAAPSIQQLLEHQTLALNRLKTVRIIPQVHKLMGWQ